MATSTEGRVGDSRQETLPRYDAYIGGELSGASERRILPHSRSVHGA